MTKADIIRERLKEVPPTQEPPRTDTYDADKNTAVFNELKTLSKKTGLQTYIVMWGEQPIATIVFKITVAQVTAIATKLVNGRRVMFKQSARSHDYDRFTAALAGLTLPQIYSHYEVDKSPAHFVIRDQGKRWDRQLVDNKFNLWRTL